MIGLDDVPCTVEFTMRELAAISLAAAEQVVNFSNPQLMALLARADSDKDRLERILVLTGIVRKIDDAIREKGLQELLANGERPAH